jgi:RNA polymerase sigma-70 factor (ECF subfamily)
MITEQFNEINKNHAKAIKRICGGYEFNEQRAEELYQEVMTSIWQSLSNFKKECSLKTWSYRVAYNKCISHSIKESKKKETSLNSIEDIEHLLSSGEFDNQMVNKNLLERIKNILKTTKPIDREVFILFLEGESGKNISDISGLTESNVSTKISRVKKVISSIMENENE